MRPTVILKRGDTSPPFTGTLRDADGQPVNLTGASLRFLMRFAVWPKAIKVDAPAAITDPAGGRFSYAWTPADTDLRGEFEAELEVTYLTGEVETFPSPGYQAVSIREDIG